MGPEGAVPAQFVEGYAPVGRDPDRVQYVDLRRREGTGPTAAAKSYQRCNAVARSSLLYCHGLYGAANDMLRLHFRRRPAAYSIERHETHRRRPSIVGSAI